MKNVTLETLLKGMSPFALALLLSISGPAFAEDAPESHDLEMTEETAKPADEEVASETATSSDEEAAPVKKKHSKKKHKHSHASHSHGASNPEGVKPAEATVDISGETTSYGDNVPADENLEIRAPGQVQ